MVFPWEPNKGGIYGIRLDIEGFHIDLKACAYRKKGMMFLPRGIERYSVRPWRVCGSKTRAQLLKK